MKPSEVLASRIQELRKLRGLNQTELAERLERYGIALDRSQVHRIEQGPPPAGRGVTTDELVAIAAALDTFVVNLIFPADDEAVVDLSPNGGEPIPGAAKDGRAWARGEHPLRHQDARFYVLSSPPSELEVGTSGIRAKAGPSARGEVIKGS
jgi:transcriptional regulator with XRE-family HTH domain